MLGLSLAAFGGVTLCRPDAFARLYGLLAAGRSQASPTSEAASPTMQLVQEPSTIAAERIAKARPLASGSSSKDAAIQRVSYDEKSPTGGPFDVDPSQRPQVKTPTLLAPGNAPKLRELGGDTAPKLQSALRTTRSAEPPTPPPAPETSASENTPSPSKLNAPQVRKIQNPYAMQISDEGQSKSQNEQAILETSPPSLLPGVGVFDDEPIGTGVAEAPKSAPPSAPGERSVLKRNPYVTPSSPSRAPETQAGSRRQPLTATLRDADAPSEPAPLPAPQPLKTKPVDLVDHHPSNFRGVTPGVTDEKALLAALGNPASTRTEEGAIVHRFNVEPFQLIEVGLSEGVVESVTLTLKQPMPASDIIQELGLSAFEPGLVTNNEGFVLGQVYPERGIVLQFTQNESGAAEVDQIVLDKITAEPFLLRALESEGPNYTSMLHDLDVALKLDPQEPRALWFKGHLLLELGHPTTALRLIDEAIRLDAQAAGFRLTRAKALQALGKHGEAQRTVATLLAQSNLPPSVRARATCLDAELASTGPAPDFEVGIELYREAIRQATPLSEDARPAVRKLARRVMIEAHLGVGRCIAWGQLKDAATVSAQWNERAKLLAEAAIGDEDVAEEILLTIHRSIMSTHLGLMAQGDSDGDISDLQVDSQRLLRSVSDELYRARVNWELAIAYTDASRVESARGKHRSAGQLADSAWTMMQEGGKSREQTPDELVARGMLLYQLGSIAAVGKENHIKAVEWYAQAAPLLEKPLPETLASLEGLRGLAFVGMGASYWQNGDTEKALELAEKGAELLRKAAGEGKVSRAALELAHGNLESMYREIGDTASANRVARWADPKKGAAPVGR